MASAGGLKKSDAIMINGHACKIVSYTHSEPGKHGGSKVRFVTRQIFNPDKRVETFMPCSTMVEVPELEKSELVVTTSAAAAEDAVCQAKAAAASLPTAPAILFDGVADEGTLKRTVKAISIEVAESIRDRLARGEHVLLSVCRHGTNEAIMDVRACKGTALRAFIGGAVAEVSAVSTVMSKKDKRKAKKAARKATRF